MADFTAFPVPYKTGVAGDIGALSATNPVVTGTLTGVTDLTTTGNTVLGNASTDTLNVGNGGLVKDASGNVGIGAAPTYKLHVSAGGGLGVVAASSTDASGATAYMQSNGATSAVMGALTNHPLVFVTNNTERVRVDTSGNVGIGQAPGAKLDVLVAPATAGSAGVRVTDGTRSSYLMLTGSTYSYAGVGANEAWLYSGGTMNLNIGPDGAGMVKITTNGAERMRVDSSGNVGIGQSPVSTWKLLVNGAVGANGFEPGGSTVLANGMFLPSASAIGFSTSSTERMRIDSSGRVGIGASPTPANTNLYVIGTGGSTFRIDSSTSTGPYMGVYASSSGAPIGFMGSSTGLVTGASGPGDMTLRGENIILFSISSNEKARLDSSGNVLVGTSATTGNAGIQLLPSGGACVQSINHVSGTASGTGYEFFNYNGTAIGSVAQSGTTAVAYNTTSDRRLKTHIADASEAGDVIDSIRVRAFDWKADPHEHVTHGFIAQELITVAPHAVTPGDDGEDITTAWGIDAAKLVPLLVREVQCLRTRVHDLEATLH